MRRWTVDMTEAAIEWNKNFDVEMDLPRQRCVSSGLVNNFGSAPEIFQDEIRSMQSKGWSVIGNIRFDFKLLEEGLNAKEKDKWRANFKLHMVKYES